MRLYTGTATDYHKEGAMPSEKYGVGHRITFGRRCHALQHQQVRHHQRRAGAPGEIAQMALFLVSDAASYVNGQAFAVDGGLLSSLPVVLHHD
jgi:NAD(P)-dependent dehydrogenase (short-subunit alcohol dehydrogenase family)